MNAIIAGVLRHILTTAGGAGAVGGIASDDPYMTTVSVISILAGALWSWYKNKNA